MKIKIHVWDEILYSHSFKMKWKNLEKSSQIVVELIEILLQQNIRIPVGAGKKKVHTEASGT